MSGKYRWKCPECGTTTRDNHRPAGCDECGSSVPFEWVERVSDDGLRADGGEQFGDGSEHDYDPMHVITDKITLLILKLSAESPFNWYGIPVLRRVANWALERRIAADPIDHGL